MPERRLANEDLKIIEELREFRVLDEIKNHLLDQRNGAILITCSDGDQMHDIFKYHVKMQKEQCADPRIHTFAWHGGALRLVPNSPINQNDYFINQRYKRVINKFISKISASHKISNKLKGELVGDLIHALLMGEVATARELKKINTVALYNHITCLMAKSCHLDILDVMHYLISAKTELKKENHGIKVACFCQIDYTGVKEEGNTKKSYFVAKHRWIEYLKFKKIPPERFLKTAR